MNEIQDMNNISMYDLAAEDLTVWVQKNKKFGFDLQIEGEDPNERIEIKGVHTMAMESFSDFCRSFLHFYEQAKQN